MYEDEVLDGWPENLMTGVLTLYRLIAHGNEALNPDTVEEILHQHLSGVGHPHGIPTGVFLFGGRAHCVKTKRGGHRALGYGDKGGLIHLL